jgi:uncharacterized phage protein gp47/JayE
MSINLNYPSSSEILSRIRADIKQLLPNSDPYIITSILNVIATANTNRMKEIYDQLRLISRDSFVTTAQGQALLERALIEGIIPKPATQSTGNALFTGVVGSTIPASTELTAQGITFETSTAVTISTVSLSVDTLTSSGGVATVTISAGHGLGSGMTVTIAGAVETDYNGDFDITVISSTVFEYTVSGSPTSPATGTITASIDMATSSVTSVETGTDANIQAGSTLSLSNTIVGVDSTAFTDSVGIDGAEDAETSEELRERTLQKKQNPNTPFNAVEIETQARTIEGVTRVFVFESNDLTRSETVTITSPASGIAEATFPSDHDLLSGGTKVRISGANESAFNGDFRILVIADDEIAYYGTGITGTATGTITCDYPQVQLGQVAIYFLRDNDDNIIPSTAEIEEVRDKILEIKPANTDDANVFVFAPTPVSNDFTFTALEPNTQGIRDSVNANLAELFLGLSLGETLTEIAYQTAIQNSFDASNNIGVTSFTISAPSGDLTAEYDEILTLGTVSFP